MRKIYVSTLQLKCWLLRQTICMIGILLRDKKHGIKKFKYQKY